MAHRCPRCGCEERYSGALESQVFGLVFYVGKLQFLPDKDERPFLSTETRGIKVSASMCEGCGLLELVGDAGKLRRVAEGAELGVHDET